MVRSGKIKRTLYVFMIVFVLYTLTGFFLAPWIGQRFLIKRWGHFMGRSVAIETVSINPYTLTLLARGISIKENTGIDFVSARSLLVDFSILSLFRLAPVSTRYEMDSPVVNLVLNKDHTFNVSDLMETSDQPLDPQDPSREAQKIFKLKIANAKILNGQINFSDQIRNQEHHIEKLNLNLPFLSTLEGDMETTVSADIDFSLNQAGIKIRLESLPFTPGRDTTLSLETGTVDLLKYLVYLPLPKTLRVNRMETSLDLAMTYSRTNDSRVKDRDKPALILKGGVKFANIDIQDVDHTPVLNLPQMDLVLAPSDLLEKKLGLATLKILSPKIHLARDASGSLNLLKYLPVDETPVDEKGRPHPEKLEKPGISGAVVSGGDKESPGFVFRLQTGEIVDASVFFTDAANKTPFKTVLSPVSIQVRQVVAHEGIVGKYRISLKTEADERLVSAGQFSTAPLKFEGAVTLEQLTLKKYLPYVENLINFDVQEGQLDLDAGFEVSETETESTAVIHNNELRLTNLTLWDRVNKEIPVSIPELTITDSVLDARKQRLDMGKIKVLQGKILLKRQADGSVNLVKNMLPSPHISQETEKKSASLFPAAAQEKTTGTWEISLSDFSLGKFEIDVSDAIPKEPVLIKLSDVSVQADNLKNQGEETSKIAVEAAWNQTGRIQLNGDLAAAAPAAELDIFLDNIEIQSLQPYFTEQVNILVTKGLFQAQGRLAVSMKEKNIPQISFKGKTSITDFASSGKFSGKEFFNCSSLYLTGMDISVLPVKVVVEDISLTDFFSRVIISEKGNINFRQIMAGSEKARTGSRPEQAAAAEKKTAGPRPEIRFSNVTLQGGQIYYEDNFTQPNVSADMKEIAGQVKGLSSLEGGRPADLQLRGLHGRSSPLDISGRFSPLTPNKFLDLNISFKDIELTRFSSYSAKYIGYEIKKGKLVLDLNYKLDKNILLARNRLLLDRFTLGKKVDSKDATSLPVSLAISLLKNADGQIDLDVPITGNLDDPEFKLSNAFFEVFGNLIMKVVTAPFKILGAMFGGGEELGFANFAYGSDILTDKAIEKLDTLIEILDKKKPLNLEIQGTYDRNSDGEVLRKKEYEALIKSGKIKALAAKGIKFSSSEKISLLPEEREAAVMAAYELADFSKPREADGTEKQISIDDKEKLLITHMDINEHHLKELALTRAENIKHYILSAAKVASERIFLLNPVEAEAGSDPESFARVNFSIR